MGYPVGVKEQRAYEMGKKLTLKQSVIAKCAECCGNYADGKIDCGIPECSLYPFMRYGVAWEHRVKRIISSETKERLLHGLKRGINKARA